MKVELDGSLRRVKACKTKEFEGKGFWFSDMMDYNVEKSTSERVLGGLKVVFKLILYSKTFWI